MTSAPGDGDQVDDLAEGGYLRHDYDAGGILPVSLGLVVNDTGQPERVITAAELAACRCLCACHRCCVPPGEPCGDPGCCDGQS